MMSEPRKIVLILGNGFDLDLGLKTTYKDFWESNCCPIYYPAPLIHHLNNSWPENKDSVKWYDLENELLNYYKGIDDPQHGVDFITSEELSYLNSISQDEWYLGPSSNNADLVQSLVDKGVIILVYKDFRQIYIPYKDDISESPSWRDRTALKLIKEGLCKYLNALKPTIQATSSIAFQVLAFLDVCAGNGDAVNVYSFNYTPVLINGRSPEHVKVHHMHGSCKEGRIIIGTRDDKDFNANYDFLQKAFDPNFNPPALVSDLQDADEVIFFGHSIGENDRQYFKSFFIQQTSFSNPKRKDIYIFTKDEASEMQIKRSLQYMTDSNLSTLYGLNNMQIIKTGSIKDDQGKLLEFLVKHGKEELATREFIGKLIERCAQ